MKQVVFLFLCMLLAVTQSSAQQDSLAAESNKVYEMVDQLPEFPNGQDAMYKYIVDNLTYPKKAINNNTEGRVIVKFVVNKEGNVVKAKVIKGIGDGCDEEALRVVRTMPKWTPGYQNGKPVNVYYMLPFSFRLEKQKKSKNRN